MESIEVGDSYVFSSSHIRYLSIHIDARLSFKDHLRMSSERDRSIAGESSTPASGLALSRIMPIIGGHRPTSAKQMQCSQPGTPVNQLQCEPQKDERDLHRESSTRLIFILFWISNEKENKQFCSNRSCRHRSRTLKSNNFYSESQSDLCYSRGPGREHVAWVLVTLGKSAALLRKVQEVCSAQELTSECAQRPGAPAYIARRDGGGGGGSGEPLLESRPRTSSDIQDPSVNEKPNPYVEKRLPGRPNMDTRGRLSGSTANYKKKRFGRNKKRVKKFMGDRSRSPTTDKASTSAKKVQEINVQTDDVQYRIIDINILFPSLERALCCARCNGRASLSEQCIDGLGFQINIEYLQCQRELKVDSSQKIGTMSNAYEINRRSVLMIRSLGHGHSGLETLCGLMDTLPPITQSHFDTINSQLCQVSKSVADVSMREAVKKELDLSEGEEGLTVSGDGFNTDIYGNDTNYRHRDITAHIQTHTHTHTHTLLRTVSAKAAGVIGALAKIMPNFGGPRSSRRKLYAHVVDSILLYGAPVWSTAAQKRAYIRQAESAHRRACLRVIGGQPHVAYEATYVLASIPPLALLADERARLYGRRREDAKDEKPLATLSKWQEAWDRSTKGPMDAPTDPKYQSVDREEARRAELPAHATLDWAWLL
ncbi:unnamed protein product [Trichogramma brassicae]|uniref:Mutator-like transposase domain-containing protein n=1 Tax=Trichogramma brassicae TaxID=86971 RepID=A0A6H5J415_9HYME|nr:unnamed protein product [Trichogramma brassicae]